MFAVAWALASLFHLLGNAQVSLDRLSSPGDLRVVDWGHLALGAVALAVLCRPSDRRRLHALAVLGVVTVGLELPILSNHWLVAGFVDLAWLGAAALAAARPRPLRPGLLWQWFAPTARLVLVVFYVLAAFAKLNQSFLDAAVSCATYFFEESSSSMGLDGFGFGTGPLVDRVVILSTIAVELAIPALLVVRRTRHVGVVLGLAFHFVLALDQAHQFIDFSALLFALFLLFLPDGFADWARSALATRWPGARRLTVVAATALCGLALARSEDGLRDQFLMARQLAWLGAAAVTLVAVVGWLRRERPEPRRRAFGPGHPALALVLVLVVLNGLTPYLEVKSAFGFTMYSNLRLVAGESNHLIVPRSLPLGDAQRDLVTIVSSSDPELDRYGRERYAITWTQFRVYATDHPDEAVHYVRQGVDRRLDRLADDPALVAPVPWWQRRLFVFRAIDQTGAERCLPVWGVAR